MDSSAWSELQYEKFGSPRRQRKRLYPLDTSSHVSSDSEEKLDYVMASKKRESKDRKHKINYENQFEENMVTENVDDSKPMSVNLDSEDMKNRGKRVLFFKNGDSYSKGLWQSVSVKSFPTFETLIHHLNTKIDSVTGITNIFHLPEGRPVKSIAEFKQGHSYVASEGNKLDTTVSYGGHKPQSWANEKPQAGKVRNIDMQLYSENTGAINLNGTQQKKPGPRILTVISNTDRSSCEKIILNPQTTATYEDLLQDITGMLRIQRPPVTSLYTDVSPYIKVVSYSQLNRDLKANDRFIACGEEGVPLELAQGKRDPPGSSNSSEVSTPFSKKNKNRSTPKLDGTSQVSSSRESQVMTIRNPSKTKAKSKSPLRVDQTGSNKNGQKVGANNRESLKVIIHGKNREFFPPTLMDQDDDGEKPDKVIKLDWVYGYRGKDARNNLFVLSNSGELLYFVGAVAVIYDVAKNKQRHYCGHSEDITSMDYEPNRNLACTGQLAGKSADTAAHVRIWDTVSLNTHSIIGLGTFQSGISSLAFSIQSQGDLLMVIDDGDKHILSVWNWQAEKLIAKTPMSSLIGTTTDMVVWGSFHKRDDSTIVTFGKRHIYFWKLFWNHHNNADGKLMRDRESGIFNDDVPKFITSLTFAEDNDDVIVGDSNGSITIWSRDETDAYKINKFLSSPVKHAHKKSVFTLTMMNDGTLLSCGGSEIKAWDSRNNYALIRERVLPEAVGTIRTVSLNVKKSTEPSVYIGTTKNHILEGSLTQKFKQIVQGHSDELWGLAVHPDELAFFTAGYDCSVCRWSVKTHKNIWHIQVEKPCISIAVDPQGTLLVVGTVDGRIIVLNPSSGMHITTIQVDQYQLNALQFSPNGNMVAAGSHDGCIYIYQVIDEGLYFRRMGKLEGHRGFVTHLDFSTDSKYIQSVSGEYELYFWNISNQDGMKQVLSAKSMRDVDWQTHTCILSYNVIGPWSKLRHGEDIDSVARSSFRDYLAVGTNTGQVQLYKYPCATQKPNAYSKKGHSSHVTNLYFLLDDRCLLSTGGIEAVLMQWTVKHHLAK